MTRRHAFQASANGKRGRSRSERGRRDDDDADTADDDKPKGGGKKFANRKSS